MVRRIIKVVTVGFILFCIFTCTQIGQEEEKRVGYEIFPLEAYCEVNVREIGWIDAEGDYLPHVIQCENGGAGLEALKAQAVAARSYMYYKMETSGSIADGTSDQVYSCGRTPQPIHYQAVEETSGQVLRYRGVTVCAFYVAGADPSDRTTCIAGAGDPDYSGTERYVTYNEGLSGDDIHQTTLGWVNPANYRNRGCMSQWGSRCLEEAGYNYQEILRFYYGEDIEIETATGECITPPCQGPDLCNGEDDDCDGEVDEDFVPSRCGIGRCESSSECIDGVERCIPGEPAADDSLCNSIDDDCDGLIDEDCIDEVAEEGFDGQEPAEDLPEPYDSSVESQVPYLDAPDGSGDVTIADSFDSIRGVALEGGCACRISI